MLEPFNQFTESVSGGTTNACASLSLITLIKANINQRMSKIIANKKSHTSNEAIICLAEAILQNLERRLLLNGMVQIATVLDPSTRPLLPLMQDSSADKSDDREKCINQRLQKCKNYLLISAVNMLKRPIPAPIPCKDQFQIMT